MIFVLAILLKTELTLFVNYDDHPTYAKNLGLYRCIIRLLEVSRINYKCAMVHTIQKKFEYV